MATTPIKLKRSHTISVIPDTSDLIAGEVALNTVDKKFYVRDDSNAVVTLVNHYGTDFDSSNIILKITVATKDSSHPYNGVGSNNGYKVNGVFAPYLKLIPRNTYRFDQADSSNSGHPLRFYLDIDKSTEYTNGVTTNGTPGSAGAYTQIVVGDDTPPTLFYQCSAHGNMGWAATTSTRTNLDDPWLGSHTDTVKEYVVVVAAKNDAHVYNGQGSSLGYKVDGVFSPVLQFQLGKTYRFNQSDSSNSGHPINFYYAASKTGGNYTTNVTVNGTAGSSGAYTQILITEATPPVLHYQCTNHGYMGHASVIGTRNLTGFDTDDLSEGSSNLYHTTARVQAVSINNVVEDTSPQLGGALDTNGNNINFADNDKARFGAGNDLQIYHDGTHSYIAELGTGSLRFASDNSFDFRSGALDETFAVFNNDGNVELYHDNAKKFETTSTGIQINSTDDSSSAGPVIDLVRDSSSPAGADYLGQIAFKGDDAGGSQHTYAKISGKIVTPTAGSEFGNIEFAVVANGSNEIVARLKSDGLFLNTGNTIQFEGSTADAHETTLTVVDPTADRTISLPNASGTIALTSDIGSSDISGDSTPQLGGDLDVNGNAIVSASNGNIAITPNGSGKVIIDGLSHPVADGNAGQVLKTDGSGNLAFASVGSLAGSGIQNVSDDSSPQLGGNLDVVTHSIVSTSNRDITLAPNGSGKVVVGTNGIEFGDGSIQTAAGATQGFSIAMATALG